jgi:hypothetical protein
MTRRVRDALGGGTSIEAADAAVGRGMADVLAALDNVIDDDAALGRICAGLGPAGPAAVPAPVPARASGAAAYRRRRAPRQAATVAAVAAVLAAGAVAVVAVLVPGAGRARTAGPPAVSTAYVVQRVGSALTAADPGEIAYMTVTTHGAAIPGGTTATTTAEEWSYGDQWRAVTYSAAGHLLYDEGFATASVYTVVSYPARTWAREAGPGRPVRLAPGPRGCQPVIAALPLLFPSGLPSGGLAARLLPATVARDLRAAVSCGSLAVAGRQRVQGTEAIELTSRPGSLIPETIWVSPGTYLPMRVVIHPVPGQPGPWQTADIAWLRPTARNLARLTVAIPAGFRRVPFARAATPSMQPAGG